MPAIELPELPRPVGVGYFPKITQKRPDWLRVPIVEEICSVSQCISSGPEDWIEKWLHNALGFYDTEALALQVIAGKSASYDMYAYRVYPLQLDGGVVKPWSAPVAVELDLTCFAFLGYDPAEVCHGYPPGCSPLSCNGAAEDFPVNRYCLMDDVQQAYEACIEISKGHYEPGPYLLLEVYRRRKSDLRP